MAPKVCMTKLKKEMKAFLSSPPPHVPAIYVNERNMLEWHFLLEGPPETPYEGGWYIGKLRFPSEYPFKPPAIMMLTPSGRFATGTRLCLSMSDFHPETWNPMWTVSSILTALLSFMVDDEITTGSLKTTDEEKRVYAAASLEYNLQNEQLRLMFQKELQAATTDSSKATHASATQQATAASTSQTADQAPSSGQAGAMSTQQQQQQQQQQQSAAEAGNADEAATPDVAPMTLNDVDDQAPELPLAEHAVPPQDQSDFLHRMYRMMMERQPERAFFLMEDVLKRQPRTKFFGSLLLLKAQASAMIGNLATADEAVQTWLDDLSLNQFGHQTALSIPARRKTAPARWQGLWSVSAAAKDKGNALFRQGNFAGALAAYEQSLLAAPECSTVYCNKAAALARLERHDDAIAAAKQALNINSDYEKAHKRMNDSKAALRMH